MKNAQVALGMRRRVLVLLAVNLVLLAGLGAWFFGGTAAKALKSATGPPASARVLFIGNSFTYVNDLPELVRALAAEDGLIIAVTTHAIGGAKLQQHAADSEVRELLSQRWDYVVLQEQSQIPTFDKERKVSTLPALHDLHGAGERGGAKVVLFGTWGYRSGDGDNVPNDTYEAMQARLDHGLTALSVDDGVPLVPVGAAWAKAHREHPEWSLWGDDGKHPAIEGSYLAACVFYATLFHRSPQGNAFSAGLPKERARSLQDIAASAVPNETTLKP